MSCPIAVSVRLIVRAPHVRAPHRPCASSSVRLIASSSVRLIMAVYSLMFVLLLCPVARAGTYVWQTTNPDGTPLYSPAFSGGTVTSQFSDAKSYVYVPGQGYGTPGAFTSSLSLQGVDVKASGEIKTVFTWQPNSGQTQASDPPPAWVVVEETSSAVCLGFNTPARPSSGSCDDGLGDSQSMSVMVRYQPISCTRTRCRAMPGGLTVSLTCSPSAQATGASGVMVSYKAAVFPITLNLTGTTPDNSGNQNILVGQGCTAGVSGIPTDLMNNTAHPPVYNWSVGGNTFQSWNVTYVANTSSTAKLEKGYGVSTNSTAKWYWSDLSGPKTVSCAVTLTPPAGQGSSFTVTLTSSVNLIVPAYTASPTAGRVQINQSLPGQSGYWLYAGAGNPSPSRGMEWKVKVLTPSLFAAQTGGGWYFDQIVTPGRWRTKFGQAEKQWPIDGMTGLDKAHPYPPPPGSPSPPSGMLTGSFAANNTEVKSGDTPGLSADNDYTNYRVQETFNTYVMYVPPGNDSLPVPLHEIDWNWKTNGNSGVQQPDGGWSNWSDSMDAGIVTSTSSAKQIVHPEWVRLVIPPSNTSW